jgi:pimeloyl-ACP methyl ester carboxylesterase
MTDEITVAGVRSPYLHHGPREAKQAVVFVHGNPGPKEDWADLMGRLLDPRIRAVAPDMPGYGGADRPPSFPYTIDGYAAHLDGILEGLGIQKVHLVLHDFGGPWGLRWVADHKDRVGSLLLVNTGVLRGYRWHRYARIWQTPILGELFQLGTTRFGYQTLINAANPRPLPAAFFDRVMAAADWGHKRAVLKLYRASKDVAALGEWQAARLRGLDIPTLVLWGTGDRYIPSTHAAAQREIFPRAEVHELDGCGHWPFLDDPDRFAALAVPFLERQART